MKSNFLADPRQQTSNVKMINFCENEKKRQMAKAILHQLLQSYSNEIETDPSYRIGLSGPPGAGKSTFIENMGPDSQKTKRQKLPIEVLPTKVRCVFPIVIVPILPQAKFGPNDHREDVPHFRWR